MEAKRTTALEVTRLGPIPTVDAVLGDTGRALDFVLTDMTAPEGATAAIYVDFRGHGMISGHMVYDACTVTTVDGVTTVTTPLTSAMLAHAGKWPCQIRLQQGEQIITSFLFWLRVSGTIIDDDAIEGSNEFTALTQAMADLDSFKADVSREMSLYRAIPAAEIDAITEEA